MNSPKGLLAVAFLLISLVPIISTATPVPLPITKVSGGEVHTLILTEASTVWGCGCNSGGRTKGVRHLFCVDNRDIAW